MLRPAPGDGRQTPYTVQLRNIGLLSNRGFFAYRIVTASDEIVSCSGARGGVIMGPRRPSTAEESLDPRDWSAMRALGHRMVDGYSLEATEG